MLLTIIIPAYNEAERITKALDSIPKRDDIEVLVIDDGSTDNTVQVVEQKAPQFLEHDYCERHRQWRLEVVLNNIRNGVYLQ